MGGRWWRRAMVWGGIVALLAAGSPVRAASRLSDQPIPLDPTLSARPRPLLELGAPFLDTGPLSRAIALPGGAVWQPSLLLYGTYRTAVQTFDDGKTRFSEWANRLSVFANLQLSGTERIVLGLRPLDLNGRKYFGYQFEPKKNFVEGIDGNVDRIFFEGDVGQLFPNLDLYDRYALDYGFAVGRQPLVLQDGMLLNDTIDSVGVVRNSLQPRWASNFRVTAFYAWGFVHRDDNARDNSARLVGLDTSTDLSWGTIDVDGVFVSAKERTGDAFYGGASLVRRVIVLGRSFNTTLRVNGSYATEQDTPQTSSGVLLFGEVSRTPNQTGNFLYLNGYLGIDKFSSAARAPDAGGPLGRVGILYEAMGVGRYGSALSNRPADSVGAALGYQMFFDLTRRQVIVEVGGRKDTDGSRQGAVAVGGRVEQAVGHHLLLRFDTFVAGQESREVGYGARTELMVKF